jgi:hypothetical protein
MANQDGREVIMNATIMNYQKDHFFYDKVA